MFHVYETAVVPEPANDLLCFRLRGFLASATLLRIYIQLRNTTRQSRLSKFPAHPPSLQGSAISFRFWCREKLFRTSPNQEQSKSRRISRICSFARHWIRAKNIIALTHYSSYACSCPAAGRVHHHSRVG
ncbi:Protein of unknown function [Pyronema omphalodes CBS 100304]|uniref:Uncharacterized protein n=1 Tax=Pyronema omphalodes (strain CBS 100304) TaxID=1076935 RepID=U4KYT3_PYROM|nr:Protein of unknown function [Pyronema omphalodes CBS 100304]